MTQQEIIKITIDFLGKRFADQIEAVFGEIDEELLKKLEAATTIEECFEVYAVAPEGNDMERQALVKAISLASTIEEYLEIYEATPEGSDVERQVLEKIDPLLLQKLEAAITFDECLDIHTEAQRGSNAERQALVKAMSFALTIEEWKECFELSHSRSEEAYTCIRAIASLLSAVPVA